MEIMHEKKPVPLLKQLLRPKAFFIARGLKAKFMLALIPSVIFILLATGYFSYRLSNHFITIALKRNVLMRNLAIRHDLEIMLRDCRTTLLVLAQNRVSPDKLKDYMVNNQQAGGTDICELSFISSKDNGHALNFIEAGQIHTLTASDIFKVKPNPLLFLEKIGKLKPGQVLPSGLCNIEYPFPNEQNANHIISKTIVRFVTPATAEEGGKGFLIMSVDARKFRNILSLHNSPESPLWGYPRSDEVRYSFLFDTSGWILYQSENVEKHDIPLATYLARSGFTGTLGKPGLEPAFRPSTTHKTFWGMVQEVKNDTSGVIKLPDSYERSGVREYFLSYSPVEYSLSPGGKPYVYAGLAYLDRSQLFLSAGYKYMDVMFIIIMASVFIITLIIYGVTYFISKPINRLSKAVMDMQHDHNFKKIEMRPSGLEIDQLRSALNNMIDKVATQLEEIKEKDRTIYNVNMKEKADLDQDRAVLERIAASNDLPEIVGLGARMDEYKADLKKASQVDVDVLIVGETGTGKQLAAEAIHMTSSRSGNPFLSINCGALDENLLLDALFGHVKGAFTEARTDRKGAFQEAEGGTLFLDEIQSASPKVQQSLLRAIAARKIKPLGSDQEVGINVRLVAATNADLNQLIAESKFREDLYFRLKVLTIQVPALREHQESIPILCLHYLDQAEILVNKQGVGLSKGAVAKLRGYSWPGNIRELINCITRACVMAEDDVIQAGDIRLEGEAGLYTTLGLEAAASRNTPAGSEPEDAHQAPADRNEEEPMLSQPDQDREKAKNDKDLNNRQKIAYEYLKKHKTITRSRYEQLIEDNISSRTAIYDLNGLVKQGLAQKEGKGPATKYLLI